MISTHGRHRRNALWLHATTKGLFDPAAGKVRLYPAEELAALWAVTPKAVRNGIAGAERLQKKLTEIN